jgi:hypothetical protein
VYDVLEADGSWLTIDGIAVAGDLNPKHIGRMLYRWRHEGRVESRPTQDEKQLEWRVANG